MPLLKPVRGIQLNPTHPLSRGLAACWVMNEGTGSKIFDASRNNNSGTLVGHTIWTPGKFGSCLTFDGIDDGVDFGGASGINLGKKHSLSIWVRVTDNFAANVFVGHIAYNNGGYFLLTDGATTLYYSANGSYVGVSCPTLVVNTWYHFAVVRSATSVKFYINSLQIGATQTLSVNSDLTVSMINGYRTADVTFNWAGQADNVMIFNTALSAAEIAQLYREPFCMFEAKVSRGLLFAPAAQIVNLAGISAGHGTLTGLLKLLYALAATVGAQSALTGLFKVAYRLVGAVTGHAQVSASLTVVPQTPPPEERFTGALNIDQDWLQGALFGGMTANAFMLGTVLTEGWFWTRRSGLSALYRGARIEEIDFKNPLAIANYDARQISPPVYVTHPPNSKCFYAVQRFNESGYRERSQRAVTEVLIDSEGNLVRQPNPICEASIMVYKMKIQLIWFYSAADQKTQPVAFRIYYDAGTGTMDYQSPIGSVPYGGQRWYSFLSPELLPGRYLFGIRAENADGGQDASLKTCGVELTIEVPDAPEIRYAKRI